MAASPFVKKRVLSFDPVARMSRTIAALYRFLYAALLSHLPETAAVALGQSLLRAFPLDRLGVFRLNDARLAIILGGIRLANPVILAAMYYDPAILGRAMGLGFGAVTAKSITIQARPGHPQPSLVRTSTDNGPGLVNCNGFQNPGLERFRASIASLAHRVPLIVSVAGETIADYVRLVRELGPLGDLVEFNISSPNTKLVYEWSRKPGELAALLREVRGATAKPLIVKLSPDFDETNQKQIIPAALDAGVRIVNYGNTR